MMILGSAQIASLDSDSRWVRSLDGSEYMPGLVGLNNMKANDYVNVIIQVIVTTSYSTSHSRLPCFCLMHDVPANSCT
jgi:U4/U6.U5 tri-snRNP-associated protein 2